MTHAFHYGDVCSGCGQAPGPELCASCISLALAHPLNGKYELTQLIGQGASGAVFEARHTQLGRRCAIKLLHRTLSRHPASVARFHREAIAVAATESPFVVSVMDVGETEDKVPFIVMEYLEGITLRDRLSESSLPIAEALEIGRQICLGIAAAHARGIVHRDLKPENVFFAARVPRRSRSSCWISGSQNCAPVPSAKPTSHGVGPSSALRVTWPLNSYVASRQSMAEPMCTRLE